MKIIMIRHEQVNMSWRKKYNSITFDQACAQYDKAPIVSSHEGCPTEKSGEEVYISELSRTYETANLLFDRQDFYKTALLNEVPLRSFKDTDREYPLWLWFFMGRFQWFLQNKRQPECRKESGRRAEELIQLLEKRGADCCLVTHGFYLKTLIRELKKKGYRIRYDNFRARMFGISNLERIVAEISTEK